MKKIIFLLSSFILIFLLGCTNTSSSNQTEINLTLDLREWVTVGNTSSYEYAQTINIDNAYEIISIEILTTDFSEFPYESYFVNKNRYKNYLDGIENYLNQIEENSLNEDAAPHTGPKAKLIISLSDGDTNITLYFFQNTSNEISGSMIKYSDNQSIDFIHYCDDDNIVYTLINEMI